MKHLSYIILTAIIAILYGCNGHEAFKASLDRADSMLNVNPDSAFALLRDLRTASADAPRQLRMRYLLLWAQGCNKTYRRLPSADTLQTIVDYYDDNGNERMTSLYMMGCLYRDSGDVRKALEYFNESVTIADTTDSDCDFYILSRVYGQLSELFNKQKSPMFGLKYSKIAERMAWKAKDTLGMITFMDHTAWAYELLRDTDSIYQTIKNVEHLYKKLERYKEAAQAMPPLINIYLSKDSLPQAKEAIDRFESYSGYFDVNNNIKDGLENYYDLKGRYYFQVGRVDSAIYFYHKLLYFPNNINNLKDGYNGLVNIYRQLGNQDSVAKYNRLAIIIADSINKITSPENFALSHVDYYAEHSKKLVEEHNERMKWLVSEMTIIVFIIIITGYFIYIVFNRKQSEKQKELDVEKRKNKRSEEKYIKVKTDYESAKKIYNEALETKTQKISELEKTIYIIQKENEATANMSQGEKCDESMALQLSAHLSKLRKDAQKGMTAAKEDLFMLKFLVSECDSGFFKHISSQQYDLADRELFICILIRHDFKPAEISSLLNISPQLTTNLRARINHKLFGVSGTKHLDDNLKRLDI